MSWDIVVLFILRKSHFHVPRVDIFVFQFDRFGAEIQWSPPGISILKSVYSLLYMLQDGGSDRIGAKARLFM